MPTEILISLRRCPRCRRELGRDAYTDSTWRRGGYCRECVREYNRAYYVPAPRMTCTVEGCTTGVREQGATCAPCRRKAERRPPRPVTTYAGIHSRLRAVRGAARTHACVDCGERADEWSYDHADPDEIDEETRPGLFVAFSLDLDHYEPRCRGCHSKFDVRDAIECLRDGCTTTASLARSGYCSRHNPEGRRRENARRRAARAAEREAEGRAPGFVAAPDEHGRVRLNAGGDVGSETEQKWCPDCSTMKPLASFSVDRHRKSGRASKCLPCDRERAQRTYARRKAAALVSAGQQGVA